MTGTLRLHFTAEDLLRTRVLTEPDPLWELVLSVHHLSPAASRTGMRRGGERSDLDCPRPSRRTRSACCGG